MSEIKKTAEVLKYEKSSDLIVREAENLSLAVETDLQVSGQLLVDIKQTVKLINTERDKQQGPAYQTYKAVKAFFDKVELPFTQAWGITKRKDSALRLKLDNERLDRERKLELERQEKERKEKEKLRKQAEKATEKGQTEKAEMLKELESDYFQPIEGMDPVDNTIELESGKTHGVADIKLVSLDVKHIIQGLSKGMIPVHYLKVVMKDGEPQSLSMTGFKQFMKSKFGNVDQSYYGITVKKIIRSSVSAGV